MWFFRVVVGGRWLTVVDSERLQIARRYRGIADDCVWYRCACTSSNRLVGSFFFFLGLELPRVSSVLCGNPSVRVHR